MSSRSQQKKAADLSSLVDGLQAFPELQQEEVVEVNSIPYQEISPGQFMLDSAIVNKIGDKELYDFYMKEPSEERLEAIILTKTYLSMMEIEEDKKRVKDLLYKTDPKDLLKILSMELSGKLPEAEQSRIAQLKLNSELTVEKEKTKDNDFEYRNLVGKLGKGNSIRYKDEYFENRVNDEGNVLRITQRGDEFIGTMSFDYLSLGHTEFENLEGLASIIKRIFNWEYQPDLKHYMNNCHYRSYCFGDFSLEGTEYSASFMINHKDYSASIEYYPSLLISGFASLFGIALTINGFSGEPSALPYGIGLLSLGMTDLITGSKNKHGWGGIFQSKLEHKIHEKQLNGIKTISGKFDDVKEHHEVLASCQIDSANYKRFKPKSDNFEYSYKIFKEQFETLNKIPGYFIRFKCKTIDEVYSQAQVLCDSIKANSIDSNKVEK